jgi:hypothetical protein
VLESTQEVPLEGFNAVPQPDDAGFDITATWAQVQVPELGLGELGASNLSCDGSSAAGVFRPLCQAGIDSPESTSLKWGSDGELTALDLHHVLARLLACDQAALGMIEAESTV